MAGECAARPRRRRNQGGAAASSRRPTPRSIPWVRSISRRRCPTPSSPPSEFAGQVTVVVAREKRSPRVARHLKDAEDFSYCVDVTAVDWKTREPRLRRRLPLLLVLEERPDPRQVRRGGRRGGAFDRDGLPGGQLVGAGDLGHVRDPFLRASGPAAHPDLGRIQRASRCARTSRSRASTRARRSIPRSGPRAAGPGPNDPEPQGGLVTDEPRCQAEGRGRVLPPREREGRSARASCRRTRRRRHALRRPGDGAELRAAAPSTHGVLRLVLKVDGEKILEAKPDVGLPPPGHREALRDRDVPDGDPAHRPHGLRRGGDEQPRLLPDDREAPRASRSRAAAQLIRVILDELQRLSSHLVWLGTSGHRPRGRDALLVRASASASRSSTSSRSTAARG